MTDRFVETRHLRESAFCGRIWAATQVLLYTEKEFWRGFFSPWLCGVSRWCWLEAVRWFLRPGLLLVCGLVAFAQLRHFPIFYEIVERTRGLKSNSPRQLFITQFLIVYLCAAPLCLCFWVGLTLGGRRLKHLYRDLQVSNTSRVYLLGCLLRNAMLLGSLAYLLAVVWTLFVVFDLDPHELWELMPGNGCDYILFNTLVLLGVTWIPGWPGIVFSLLAFRVARGGSTRVVSGAIVVLSLIPSLPHIQLIPHCPRLLPGVIWQMGLWSGSNTTSGILAWALLILLCQSVLLAALGKESSRGDGRPW